MEENITNQDTSSVSVPLNEPHFDEEATLLSARPVVPLTEVKAEVRSRRRLVFVFSILIAVTAGAVGGTLLYKYQSQKSAAEVQTAIPDAEPASGQTATVADGGGATLGSHSNALSTTDEKTSETIAPEKVDSTLEKPSTKAAPRDIPRATAGDRDPENKRDDRIARENDDDDDDSEREMRREERKEARKEARRREREGTSEARRNRDTSDDLLRIREIFEGAPKP